MNLFESQDKISELSSEIYRLNCEIELLEEENSSLQGEILKVDQDMESILSTYKAVGLKASSLRLMIKRITNDINFIREDARVVKILSYLGIGRKSYNRKYFR